MASNELWSVPKDMTKIEYLESMDPQKLAGHILNLGEKVTEIENEMNLASDVLEGVYGLTVEQVLHSNDPRSGDKEKQNGEKE